MAELVKKLHFKQDTVEQTAKAYSTTAEAGTEYITNKIDDLNYYIAVGNTLDNRATKGSIIKAGTTATKCILSSGRLPYNKVEYRTPGTYTVTFPAGVTTAKITNAGAGGGGGGAGGAYSGGAGGRGNLIVNTQAVISAKPYSIYVGAGGTGGAGGNGTFSSGSNGNDGEASLALGITAIGGGGGKGGSLKGGTGNAGTSYGSGGIGGIGGKASDTVGGAGGAGSSGNNGWVIIEYGGDI